ILGSVVTFACYFYMLKRVSLMAASTLVLIQPVLALLVDALFEKQVRLVGRSYLGVAITFSGVALALGAKWRSARRAAAGAAPPTGRRHNHNQAVQRAGAPGAS